MRSDLSQNATLTNRRAQGPSRRGRTLRLNYKARKLACGKRPKCRPLLEKKQARDNGLAKTVQAGWSRLGENATPLPGPAAARVSPRSTELI